MTERGLPPEGAPACPFVAFEDDRDGRSTAPDHRHRCFAEARPAPRALAHQEAYCLSSAFPVCPTFQDWARREAAAARPNAPSAATPRDEDGPQSRPMPPLDRDGRHVTDTPPPVPPRRSSQRDWAAPPPWSGEGAGPGPAGPAGVAAAGASGAAYAAAWDEPDGPDPDVPVVRERDRPPTDWGDASRGLAGSAAHRLAGPDPDEPYPATPQPSRYERPADPAPAPSRYQEPSHDDDVPRDDEPDDDRDDDAAWAAGAGAGAYVAGTATASGADASRYAPPPSRRQPPPQSSTSSRSRDTGKDAARQPQPSPQDQVRRPQRQEAQELFGPAWEPARRYEAYPSLKTRIGVPSGVPKVAMWALILVAVAVLLFLFGPRLLGLVGSDGGLSGASPTPSASVEPTATPEPTEPPAPTPQVYTVAKGDTMSKIANKFDVSVEAIMDANPQIKNPDRIQIGDEITIPTPEPENGFPEESAAP
jgi:LysM repeat protein